MSGKKYVLDGAMVQCNQGYMPAKLLVTENQKVKIQGKFKATDMDIQIPQTFGQCKLKPSSSGHLPCIPALQKWTKTSVKTTLGGSKKFLFEDSECMCGTGGKVTIMQGMQINVGGATSEQFKQIAMAMPGAMMGNDRAPKVLESYWMDKAGGEQITSSLIGKKAYIHLITENMDVGELVSVTVKDNREREENRIYEGNVKSDGTAKLDLVPLEKDTVTKRSNESACIIADEIDSETTPPQESSRRKLLEKGIIQKGHTNYENGKTIVVNAEGIRGYDWVYGDNPSTSLMKKNGMSVFDIGRIKLKNMTPSASLIGDMALALVGNADIEDGLGQNGRDLINHFIKGQGKPFIFDTNSNPVKEIKDSSKFKDEFIPKLKKELLKRYEKNDYINKLPESVYHFKTGLPTYGIGGLLDYRVNEVTTFIGGLQGCTANYEVYQQYGQIDVKITSLSFIDTFGAGWEDGGANDWLKQLMPGLVSMFCLQHFKNVKDKSKFQPFAIKLNIKL